MRYDVIRNLSVSAVLSAGLGLCCLGIVASPGAALAAQTTQQAQATPAAPAQTTPAPSAQDEPAQYADGTFEATGKGIGGKLTVSITIKSGKITEVAVVSHKETAGYAEPALETLPTAIVAAQGIDGVDVVAGATVTSGAILDAARAALEKAAPLPVTPKLVDGVYEATGTGRSGEVLVRVTVRNAVIANVEIVSSSETEGIGTRAFDRLAPAIVSANGIAGVDALAGATESSKALFEAVEEVIKTAAIPEKDSKAAPTGAAAGKTSTQAGA